jgi:hypothetical protein
MSIGSVIGAIYAGGSEIDIHLFWFLCTGVVLLSGIPMANAASTTLYSRVVGTYSSDPAYMNSLSKVIMGIARVCGPLSTGFFLVLCDQLQQYWPLFAILGLFIFITALSLLFAWSQLSPGPNGPATPVFAAEDNYENGGAGGGGGMRTLADHLMQGLDEDDLILANSPGTDRERENNRKWGLPGTPAGSEALGSSGPRSWRIGSGNMKMPVNMNMNMSVSKNNDSRGMSPSPRTQSRIRIPVGSNPNPYNPYLPQGTPQGTSPNMHIMPQRSPSNNRSGNSYIPQGSPPSRNPYMPQGVSPAGRSVHSHNYSPAYYAHQSQSFGQNGFASSSSSTNVMSSSYRYQRNEYTKSSAGVTDYLGTPHSPPTNAQYVQYAQYTPAGTPNAGGFSHPMSPPHDWIGSPSSPQNNSSNGNNSANTSGSSNLSSSINESTRARQGSRSTSFVQHDRNVNTGNNSANSQSNTGSSR